MGNMNDNYTRTGIVKYIIDGDTIDIECDLGFYVKIKERFRIKGIDTPEIYGKTRGEGLKAKKFLEDTLLNKEVSIISRKMDGFRRWLADIFYIDAEGNQRNLSLELLQNGLAIVMNSESKETTTYLS